MHFKAKHSTAAGCVLPHVEQTTTGWLLWLARPPRIRVLRIRCHAAQPDWNHRLAQSSCANWPRWNGISGASWTLKFWNKPSGISPQKLDHLAELVTLLPVTRVVLCTDFELALSFGGKYTPEVVKAGSATTAGLKIGSLVATRKMGRSQSLRFIEAKITVAVMRQLRRNSGANGLVSSHIRSDAGGWYAYTRRHVFSLAGNGVEFTPLRKAVGVRLPANTIHFTADQLMHLAQSTKHAAETHPYHRWMRKHLFWRNYPNRQLKKVGCIPLTGTAATVCWSHNGTKDLGHAKDYKWQMDTAWKEFTKMLEKMYSRQNWLLLTHCKRVFQWRTTPGGNANIANTTCCSKSKIIWQYLRSPSRVARMQSWKSEQRRSESR